MRRFAKYLLLTAILAGCDSASDPVSPAIRASNTPSFEANAIVDQTLLIPVPPPGAVCHADGLWTICHTEVSLLSPGDEPVLELPCGPVYERSTDTRHGIRWYNSDNRLVKRFVTQDLEGTWSLSPVGAAPTVTITAHDNWRNVYPVPGDLSSELQVNHGDGFTVEAPGFGVIAHIAGMDRREDQEAPHGVSRDITDPAVASELCSALTR
jgi:hypothetical protein